jgi:hypothetical protein
VREHGLEGSFWPTELQKLLLRTAFTGEEASAAAWRQVGPQLDLDELELGSFPLLPLVHRQLDRLGIEDRDVPRLTGIYRRTWYLNRVRLEGLTPALRALEDCGAEPVVVDGWQIPAHYYDGDFGLRPVEDLDVLVRPGRADAAARALARAGFEGPRDVVAGAARFVHADGRTCVLHQRLSREFSAPERGGEVEELGVETFEISLGELSARALGPADELVRVCLTGARATQLPNVLWVAEALAVVRKEAAAIDWERLVRQARRLRATLRLRDALVYLHRELDAPIPADTVRQLEATPTRRRERLAHREAGRRRRLIGPSPRTATRFLNLTSDRSVPAALAALPSFLRDELGLERRAQVPVEVVRRAVVRTRRVSVRRPRRAAAPPGRSTVEVK